VPGSLVGGVWLQREEAVDAGGSAPSYGLSPTVGMSRRRTWR
jgi:hypothetical protein